MMLAPAPKLARPEPMTSDVASWRPCNSANAIACRALGARTRTGVVERDVTGGITRLGEACAGDEERLDVCIEVTFDAWGNGSNIDARDICIVDNAGLPPL